MSTGTPEVTDVLVVGGGQAGIAMSEHLTKRNIAHIVVERERLAERWRTARWDSLVANGPAWHDRFPSMGFDGVAPDEFAPKDRVADYLESYARGFGGDFRTGVSVDSVRPTHGPRRFLAETSAGPIAANYVVAATGAFQLPSIPPIVPESAGLTQLHSSDYRNPAQLPEGGVLVVGAGSSGVQIAAELRRAGRDVTLAVGPHDRPPQRYRGRAFVWWLGALGLWQSSAPKAGAEHVTIAVSGADGGHTVDFRDLADDGVRLVGRASGFANGKLTFDGDLADNIRGGDENYLSVLDAADAYIERNGLDLPEEPEARLLGPLPEDALTPIRELDVVESGITTIVWATGFRSDYSWLEVPGALDDRGLPAHQRGVSAEDGIYFLGLPWQASRGSTFIWGVWHDAKYIADQIEIKLGYAAYEGNGVPWNYVERPARATA